MCVLTDKVWTTESSFRVVIPVLPFPPLFWVFTPSKEEIIKAKRIIDQFNASDTGLVVIDGKLIEKPVLREMKRRILVADKINQWVFF